MSVLPAIGNTPIVELQSYNGCPGGRILACYETRGPEMMAQPLGGGHRAVPSKGLPCQSPAGRFEEGLVLPPRPFPRPVKSYVPEVAP